MGLIRYGKNSVSPFELCSNYEDDLLQGVEMKHIAVASSW